MSWYRVRSIEDAKKLHELNPNTSVEDFILRINLAIKKYKENACVSPAGWCYYSFYKTHEKDFGKECKLNNTKIKYRN